MTAVAWPHGKQVQQDDVRWALQQYLEGVELDRESVQVDWEFWTNSNDMCGAVCDVQREFIKVRILPVTLISLRAGGRCLMMPLISGVGLLLQVRNCAGDCRPL